MDIYGDFLLESYDNEITVLEYRGESEIVRIPSFITDFPVLSIARGAFDKERTKKLLKVEVPINISKIEKGAFSKDIEVICYFNSRIKGFEFEGMWIIDPFMDETGRFRVDPKEYYGVIIE